MIEIKTCTASAPKTKYELNPKFGNVFTPYMLKMKLRRGQTDNFKAEIVPYAPEPMWPGMAGLHYGQSIFEGMKAYAQPDGNIAAFRADKHAERFQKSAARMVMAELPPEVFLECLKAYVSFSKEHVPTEPGHSLYLRPLMVASDPKIKVGASEEYMFYIMSTIAGSYFSSGAAPTPVRVMVNPQFVRAFPGGTGTAKTAGNYAASIGPQTHAAKFDCAQVLFLDAIHHEYIDEMGGMNFFILKGKDLITPKLNGCILDGVTRRSILELAASFGLSPKEESISCKDMLSGIDSGEISEAFACGTAAVISPIAEIYFQKNSASSGTAHMLKGDFSVSAKLLKTLNAIHRGKQQAPGDWLYKV